jgi:hypothetical protein
MVSGMFDDRVEPVQISPPGAVAVDLFRLDALLLEFMAALSDALACLVINALYLSVEIAANASLSHVDIPLSVFFDGVSLDTRYLLNNEPYFYAGDPKKFSGCIWTVCP